jgi:hypothetical protein
MSPSKKKVARKPAKKTAKKSPAKKKAASKKKAAPKKKAPAKKKAAPKKKAPAKKAAKAAPKKKAVKAAPKKKAAAKSPKTAAKPAKKAAATKGAKTAKAKSEAGKQAAAGAATPAPKRARPKKPITPTGPRHPKLGFKWSCFNCGAKFYDLGKEEPICPKCEADQRDRPPEEPKSSGEPSKPKVVRPMAQLLDEEEPAASSDEDIEITERPGAPDEMFDDTEDAALDIDDVAEVVVDPNLEEL